MRRDFFGSDGDTDRRISSACVSTAAVQAPRADLDARDRAGIGRLVGDVRPDLIVHCAARALKISRPGAPLRRLSDVNAGAGR